MATNLFHDARTPLLRKLRQPSASAGADSAQQQDRAPLQNGDGGAVAALERDLRQVVDGEVRFSEGDRALWATDASNYRQVPIGVVLPRHAQDVTRVMEVCRRHGAPVLMRGGGTSLAGQCCNVAVVMDTSKYFHGVVAVDPQARLARVLPGTTLDALRGETTRHHLTFAPDPATHTHNSLGGMIGNNSCGPHSVMAGRTADNVEALDVLLYDGTRLQVGPTSPAELEAKIQQGGRAGEIYGRLRQLRDRYADLIRQRFPRIPRRVSGYNLDELLPENGFHVARALVGSEGTCVSVLEATVKLVPWPKHRILVVLGYPDVYTMGDHIPEVMSHQPMATEGLDHFLIDLIKRKGIHQSELKMLPQGQAFLLVEFGGETVEEAKAKGQEMMNGLRRAPAAPAMELIDDPRAQEKLWLVREAGLGVTARVPGQPDAWPGWEDSAVAPEQLGNYLRELRDLFHRFDYHASVYGHFGQGCVHCRIDFDLLTQPGIKKYRAFVERAADLVVRYGGSLSGEHGDGQSRAELLPKMYGSELMEAFREFKSIWDPDWKMNPGKVIDANRLDENLRLGVDYRPWKPRTHFQFPDDRGDFSRAAERCVGIGECRRHDSGTMCPSYMVLREEEHATRGRAHLLFEMLRGGTGGGWRDENVREALDLCLACKGCKGDCPVNVDMATYKAEFLSHYYSGRLRPRAAYAMGLIPYWVRLASHFPGAANLMTQTPLLARMAKALGGIAPERTIPTFPSRTFKQQFFARPVRNPDGPPVLLFADTFNNHFFPDTAMAAVDVLESAGYRVQVPAAPICCGRPLYDFGMLPTAKRFVRDLLARMRPYLRAGTPVVGLEPSCISTMRDEMPGLFPNDPDVLRLRTQVSSFAQFVDQHSDRFSFTRMDRQAVVHGHCHAKSLWGMTAEEKVMARLVADHHLVDSGCCGMAGSFGFEKGEKYQVSIQAGERKLLPAVRAAEQTTVVVADGFSCREQIRQQTSRRALHVAEVARMTLAQQADQTGPHGPRPNGRTGQDQSPLGRPEDGIVPGNHDYPLPAPWKPTAAAAVGLAALTVGLVGRQSRRPLRLRRVMAFPWALGTSAGVFTAAAGVALLAWQARRRRDRQRPALGEPERTATRVAR